MKEAPHLNAILRQDRKTNYNDPHGRPLASMRTHSRGVRWLGGRQAAAAAWSHNVTAGDKGGSTAGKVKRSSDELLDLLRI